MARIVVYVISLSLFSVASAAGPDNPPSSHQDSVTQIQTATIIAAGLVANCISIAYSTTTFAYSTTAALKYGAFATAFTCRKYPLDIIVWTLCIALVVESCIVEQGASSVKFWFATCLAFSWLVSTILYVHRLIRSLQRIGRADSFIVTTAMLSFAFIKAFAIMGGYNMVALMRVPPCFTLAAWISSYWCKIKGTPEIQVEV